MPSPQKKLGGQAPQSLGQVSGPSPHWGSQMPLPQTQPWPQSLQVLGFSPHWGSQMPLPQTQPVLQSAGQLTADSLQLKLQMPSPHTHCGLQSLGHDTGLSPHSTWQTPSPHAHMPLVVVVGLPPPLPPPTPWSMGSGSIVERLQPALSATSPKRTVSSVRHREK